MRKFKAGSPMALVPGRGMTYLVKIPLDEKLPDQGEHVLINDKTYMVRQVEVRGTGSSRAETVGLAVSAVGKVPDKSFAYKDSGTLGAKHFLDMSPDEFKSHLFKIGRTKGWNAAPQVSKMIKDYTSKFVEAVHEGSLALGKKPDEEEE